MRKWLKNPKLLHVVNYLMIVHLIAFTYMCRAKISFGLTALALNCFVGLIAVLGVKYQYIAVDYEL